jgi:hypothetical protein
MAMLLLALSGVMDTINLPQPAAAITVDMTGHLAYITRTGDEVLIQENGERWRKHALPDRFGIVDRLLVSGDLCYVLSERNLTLCDLRASRKAIIAENVDDACINQYGEIWAFSEFELRRLSPLGRELESKTLARIPSSIWASGADLIILQADEFLPLPGWLEELMSLDACLPHLDSLIIMLKQPSPNGTALSDEAYYLLIDSKHALRMSLD